MIDAVASYHTSHYSCGVARFSGELARRAGVPFVQWSEARHFHHPLLSVKFQEMIDHGACGIAGHPTVFDLFVHDVPPFGLEMADHLIGKAEIVYAANPSMAETLRQRYHRAVLASYCPPTFTGSDARGFSLFTFGMAGRVAVKAHQRLREILDAELRQPWTLSVSCAIHEGHNYEKSLSEHERTYRQIYGDHLRILGCLADDAIQHELLYASVVPLFYEPAARANHTSLWLALSKKCVVITNLDAESPPELAHGVNVFDIWNASGFLNADERRIMRMGAAKVAEHYSWERLVPFLQPQPADV